MRSKIVLDFKIIIEPNLYTVHFKLKYQIMANKGSFLTILMVEMNHQVK